MNIHLVSTMTFGNSGWRNGVRPFSLLASEPFFLISLSLNSLFRFLFHYLCCQFACDTIKKKSLAVPLFSKNLKHKCRIVHHHFCQKVLLVTPIKRHTRGSGLRPIIAQFMIFCRYCVLYCGTDSRRQISCISVWCMEMCVWFILCHYSSVSSDYQR